MSEDPIPFDPEPAGDLPDPPVPADLDLRDFDYMPLKVAQLRDSDFANSVDHETFRAGVMLWCASWHQVPAGSLPNDPDICARLIGGACRNSAIAIALRWYWQASDGRLYHPVVCAVAAEAKTKKRKKAEAGLAGAIARWGLKQKRKRHNATPIAQSDDLLMRSQCDANGKEGKGIEEKGSTEKKATPSKRERGSRIPDGFPAEEELAWASNRGMDPDRALLTAETFRDYWLGVSGQKATKQDWPATWRNWIRRELERPNGQTRAGNGQDASSSSFGSSDRDLWRIRFAEHRVNVDAGKQPTTWAIMWQEWGQPPGHPDCQAVKDWPDIAADHGFGKQAL